MNGIMVSRICIVDLKKYVNEMDTIKVFFRNDDVFDADKKFMTLSRIFIKKKIPIHHAVIPGKLTEESAKRLRWIKEENPELIEYGQHGYIHKNYGSEMIKFEFFGRIYEKQREEIERGKEIMENFFKRDFIPAFTPPYHKYDENTLKAVDILGFKIFSAKKPAKFDMKKYGFSFVPVSLCLENSNIRDVIAKFILLRETMPVIGIYMHHHVFDADGFKNLAIFLKYLLKTGAEFLRLSEAGGIK